MNIKPTARWLYLKAWEAFGPQSIKSRRNHRKQEKVTQMAKRSIFIAEARRDMKKHVAG